MSATMACDTIPSRVQDAAENSGNPHFLEREKMPITWALNAIGIFLTTVGVLLIFLYIWKSPRFAEEWLSPDARLAYAKHRRLLIIGVGFIAAWFVLQSLAVIYL